MIHSPFFIYFQKFIKFNIEWVINCNLLKISFIWNFHNKKCAEFNQTFFGKPKFGGLIKNNISFLPQRNESAAVGSSLLLLSASAVISSNAITDQRFLPDCNHKYFYKHLLYHLNIQ